MEIHPQAYYRVIIIHHHHYHQEFFDNLSNIGLGELSIQKEEKLNFEFLLNFEHMETINVDQELSIDFIEELFAKYEYLDNIHFNLENKAINIHYNKSKTTFSLNIHFSHIECSKLG